jgi:hypothetical protein
MLEAHAQSKFFNIVVHIMYGATEDIFSSIFVATINLAAPASNINIGCTAITI